MAVFLIKQHKAVFIHIPKTGGASIRHGFFDGQVEGPKQGFIPPNWQDLFKFAFVRNPYDRIISAWKMFAGGMEESVWEQPRDGEDIDLQQFLDIATDDSIAFDGHRVTTEQKIRHHAIPQTHPFNCLEHADFVGRFESLTDDFDKVCKKLGIADSTLPHWNRTDRSTDFMQYFDSKSIEIVNEFYQEDFAQLDYSIVQS